MHNLRRTISAAHIVQSGTLPTKWSDEVRHKKEIIEEKLKATQLEEEKVKKREEAARLRAEEEAEASWEAKGSAKVLERKTEEEGRM